MGFLWTDKYFFQLYFLPVVCLGTRGRSHVERTSSFWVLWTLACCSQDSEKRWVVSWERLSCRPWGPWRSTPRQRLRSRWVCRVGSLGWSCSWGRSHLQQKSRIRFWKKIVLHTENKSELWVPRVTARVPIGCQTWSLLLPYHNKLGCKLLLLISIDRKDDF